MKNVVKGLLVAVIAVSLAMDMAACSKGGGGGGKDTLSGTTWVSNDFGNLELTFKSPNWTLKSDGKEEMKGTYSISKEKDGQGEEYEQLNIVFPSQGTEDEIPLLGDTLSISGFNFKKK